MKKKIVLFFWLILASRPAFALFDDTNGGYPAEYLLSMSGGARGLSLGCAQAAHRGQSGLLYSNPASLASLWWQEASFGMTPLFEQGQFVTAAYGHPFSGGDVFGVSLLWLTSGDAEKTNIFGESLGSFSAQERTVAVGYARKLTPLLHCGVSAKFLFQEMDTLSEKAAALDAGLIYMIAPHHTWGLGLTNVAATPLGGDALPFVPRAGFWREIIKDKLSLSMDLQMFNLLGPGKSFTRWFGGLEYRYPHWLSWRAGMNQKEVSAGWGIATKQIDFDYAFVYHPLGFLHSFTISIRYGFEETEAEKAVKEQWSALDAEKKAHLAQKEKDRERLRFEVEKLKRDTRLAMRFIEARSAYTDKRYHEAASLLQAILKEDPGHQEARSLLSEINARQDVEAVTRRLKDALAQYRERKYTEAMANINYIMEVQPSNAEAGFLRLMTQAQLYLGEKKYREAKGELIEVLRDNPDHAEAAELLKRVQTILDMEE